ncbi:MAG: glycosyltransferase [Tannerella sp.]|jgi:glycosyltransferase involved in cell wall biosynthesis|nr:glycosyltransferase [Tannerella sp.]
MDKLVSVLTPCYNGGKYIGKLLDSVLSQTCPRIEMIVIDDGSTDHSAKIIKSYIPVFEAKGYSLTYLYQENSGQSVAINRGLKLFRGDFLVWPDCDDYYATEDAIAQMAEKLDATDDTYSMVRCFSQCLDEETLKPVKMLQTNHKTKNKIDLFEDFLFSRNDFWFGAGNYMLKAKKIEKYIPGKEIYTEKDTGQNWQLILPLLYKDKCLTVEVFLHDILDRKDSHSRASFASPELLLERYQIHENTILHTLQMIEMPDKERETYKGKIHAKYDKIRFSVFLKYKRFAEARELMKKQGRLPLSLWLKFLLHYTRLLPFFRKMFDLLKTK